ncbi:MAG: hypothetical protein ACSLEL_01745 [Candidatus Malihini olakiniferum]
MASFMIWAIFFSESAELVSAKRLLHRAYAVLKQAHALDDAKNIMETFKSDSAAALLLAYAQNALTLSARSDNNDEIKKCTSF